ncbi:MAG: hypothetical protein ACRDZT_03310, partial [Acidimicrobiales bacterium]
MLPPEDRIWRHPSELAVNASPPMEQTLAARRRWMLSTPTRAGAWSAGMVGALLATGVVLVGTHMTGWLTQNRSSLLPPASSAQSPAVTLTSVAAPEWSASGIGTLVTTVTAAIVRVN